MDKEPGDKLSAFTWAMGNLILMRIAWGESVRAITSDPRMPAYCTVFRWMQAAPEFGRAVRDLRRLMEEGRRSHADAVRLARARRWKGGGQRERTPAPALDRALAEIRRGASVSEALSRPGAPSAKAFYARVRKRPAFRWRTRARAGSAIPTSRSSANWSSSGWG
jgi:hypothetical protein